MPSTPTFTENVRQRARTCLNEYGDLPSLDGLPTSYSFGAQEDCTADARKAKGKCEVAELAAFTALCELLTDRDRFVSKDEEGKAAEKMLRARHANAAAGIALRDAIAVSKPQIIAAAVEIESTETPLAVEDLQSADRRMERIGEARRLVAACNDPNPKSLYAQVREVPAGNLSGRKLVAGAISALANLDTPTIIYVDGANLAKLQHGQPAEDVNGNPVAFLTGRVRLVHGSWLGPQGGRGAGA
jgi:hypothetical protein